MSSLIPGNHKHLSLDDRSYIEQALNDGKSFRAISKYLCKDPSTISDEVFKNRIPNTWNKGSFNNPYNFCIHRFRCRKTNACKKSPFAIPFAVPAMSAIKSVTALSLNYAAASAMLLLSATAVINLVINAPFPSNMNTMPKLHTACILNGSFQPGRALD